MHVKLQNKFPAPEFEKFIFSKENSNKVAIAPIYLQDFEKVSRHTRWKISKYEAEFLSRLQLVGFANRENIVLQNVADLHIHTNFSDGDSVENVLHAAIEAGLDAIAITDHDEIEGALQARRLVHEQQLPLAVVPGIEISSKDGHIGALFVTRKIPAGLSASETVRRIHALGGIAVAHHPFTPAWLERIFSEKWGCRELLCTVPFDAIECYNAVPGSGVHYNLTTIDLMGQLKRKIAITGGSDAHQARFVGMGRTFYPGNEGILSLYKGILNGLTQGAAQYWSRGDKLHYYHHLAKEVILKIFRRHR